MNHVHNELGISKDDIREMVNVQVTRVAERYIEKQFDERAIKAYVDKAIRSYDYDDMFWGSRQSLDKYIKNEVVRKLIGGIKLEVDLKKPKSRVKKV